MRPFVYQRAATIDDALMAAAELSRGRSLPATGAPVQFLAGGTTLLDLMKIDVMRPERIVDVNLLQRSDGAIAADSRGLRLGAFARMSDAAENEAVQRDYPVVAQSLTSAASQQLRNMATLGGNVLQRTRCTYFRDVSYAACNKRNPGSGCAALEGVNRQHAVLGASDSCIATYPGDFAQALIALDASVEVRGARGARTMKFAELHRLPGRTPDVETVLSPGELITAFVLPRAAWTRRSRYLKIRDRESYEFALASAAVVLDIADGKVREARIALGGLATTPWRARAAEAILKGRVLDEKASQDAAEAAFRDAVPREHNGFKVALGKRTLIRALHETAAMEL
jgi:xanthine dehydrogenase YagS FAD-binding subunit